MESKDGIIRRHEVDPLQRGLNGLAKQLEPNLLEENPNLDFNFSLMTPEGDFSTCVVNRPKLARVLAWLRQTLKLTPEDLTIKEIKNGLFLLINPLHKAEILRWLSQNLEETDKLRWSPETKAFSCYDMDVCYGTNISRKGLGLMLGYFDQKEHQAYAIFLIEDTDVTAMLNRFHRAPEGANEVWMIRENSIHWKTLKCEKRQGLFHIIEMDSLGADFLLRIPLAKQPLVQAIQNSELPTDKVMLYQADNQRQFDGSHCALFALKDAHKMARDEHLNATLQPWIIKTRTKPLTCNTYLTPLDYMKPVQSTKAVEHYVKKTKGKASLEDVLNISFRKHREQKGDKQKEQLDPSLNQTILYFKEKYLQRVIPIMLEQHATDAVDAMLKLHDRPRGFKTPS